ncbi:ABC transporter ATP-binding protein [Mobilicoccus caccae]|uniref:ABC transporter n=1 Tax=Mobilicoccus caccae TaxID=1859295 RepID=A0ABQ6IXD7_9MICO|nr:ATP-binding cassette domain-containing protein [Mobilicoccus caccae]GMA42169.1 ABC transporter [Mobilicoccus caccae]
MIELTGLTKTFGHHRAVDDLTFTAPSGRVTGFLGPNGAGKSTALRMVCGLARPDAGSSTIDGVRFTDIPRPGRVVGVMLDAAAQHPGRTGDEVLRLAAMTVGVPASTVEPMLARVGLTGAGRKRVGQYSLGMRQRLGIAAALIGDPQVLILDEPANGLDPQGIHWMRGLLEDFAEAGGTVLLSSHLLTEVQAIADRIVVLHRGRLVMEGDADSLRGEAERQTVEATDTAALVAALDQAGVTHSGARDGLLVDAPAQTIGELAVAHRLVLTRLEPSGGDLESRFLELTRAA